MKQAVLLVLALAPLSACGPGFQPSTAPPVSSPTASDDAEPQPPNSLPNGAAVNAPLTRATGDIETTRVSPPASAATPARQRAP